MLLFLPKQTGRRQRESLVKLGAGKVDVVSESFIYGPLFYLLSLMFLQTVAQCPLFQLTLRDSIPPVPSHIASKHMFFLCSFAAARFGEHFILRCGEPHNSLLLLRPPEYCFFTPLHGKSVRSCGVEGTLSPRTCILP